MVSYTVFRSKVSSTAGVVMCKLADVHEAKLGAAILVKKTSVISSVQYTCFRYNSLND